MNEKLRAILCITFLVVVTGMDLEGQSSGTRRITFYGAFRF